MGQRCVLASVAIASAVVVSCSIEPGHPPFLVDTAPYAPVIGPALTAAGDSGVGAAGEAGGGGEAGEAGDAAAAPPGSLAVTDGGVCATVVATTLVTQQQVASPTPQPTGGVIAPGIYLLSQMNMYTGTGGATGPTSKVFAETYEVGSSTYQHAKTLPTADGGLGTPSLDSGTYMASGTSFTVHATCGIGNIGVGYSVAPGFLKLSFLNEEYVFTKH
jgi:hypothetical protein